MHEKLFEFFLSEEGITLECTYLKADHFSFMAKNNLLKTKSDSLLIGISIKNAEK